MITVYTTDEKVTFDDATRFCTDEHNNLEVLTGRQGDKPVGVFNKACWSRVLVGEEVDGEEVE